MYEKTTTERDLTRLSDMIALSTGAGQYPLSPGAAKPSRFPDAIVTRDNLGSYLVKKYKSENEVFRQLIGKDILSVCLGRSTRMPACRTASTA